MPQRVGNRHSRAVARRISYERMSGFAYQKEKSIWRVRFHPHGIFEKPKKFRKTWAGRENALEAFSESRTENKIQQEKGKLQWQKSN